MMLEECHSCSHQHADDDDEQLNILVICIYLNLSLIHI